jgi:hypothetical protein
MAGISKAGDSAQILRALASGVVLAILLASCSSSQSQPIPHASSAERLASDIQLRSSDIPQGWISEPDTSTAHENEMALRHCMGIVDPWETDQIATSKSAVFHKQEGPTNLATVSTTTEVVGSAANASARMNLLTVPTFPACKSQVVGAALESSLGAELKKEDPHISMGPVTVTVTPSPSPAGERSYTVSEKYAFHGAGKAATTVEDAVTLQTVEDTVTLQKGPVIVQINFVHAHEGDGPDPAFPTALQEALTGDMAARLADQVVAP